jgi:hypothetical protein
MIRMGKCITYRLNALRPAKRTNTPFHVPCLLNCILEIEPIDSGDARAKLRDGSFVPVSRHYRDGLR